MSPRLSVVLSTFDRPEALRVVLAGYERSLFRGFEVVVADDGSGEATEELLRSLARAASFPLLHVRQRKEGFRLAAARNLAARRARGSILVFTDGDCIPFPDALDAPAARCVPGWVLAGSRCCLGAEETSAILHAGTCHEQVFRSARARESGRLRRLFWRNRVYAWTGLKARPKLQTANAAVHRQDFERVNGFDERFVGWGYEDEDLARRLRRCGVKVLDATRESLVLHLFHPVHDTHRPDARASANYRYFKSNTFLTRPLRGLHSRKPESLLIELLGRVPPWLRDWPPLPLGAQAEVSVVFGGSRLLARRARGEVVLSLDEGCGIQTAAELYRHLLERLGGFEVKS